MSIIYVVNIEVPLEGDLREVAERAERVAAGYEQGGSGYGFGVRDISLYFPSQELRDQAANVVRERALHEGVNTGHPSIEVNTFAFSDD